MYPTGPIPPFPHGWIDATKARRAFNRIFANAPTNETEAVNVGTVTRRVIAVEKLSDAANGIFGKRVIVPAKESDAGNRMSGFRANTAVGCTVAVNTFRVCGGARKSSSKLNRVSAALRAR